MESHRVIVRIKPRVKPRPRFSKRGRAYTPQSAHDFEEVVLQAWRDSNGPTFTGPVSLSVTFTTDRIHIYVKALDPETKSGLTGDLDNYVKSIGDAIQGEGGAVINDRQIHQIKARKA